MKVLTRSNNPFHLEGGSSSYSCWKDGELRFPLEPDRKPNKLASFVHHNFRAHVLNPDFSCVGGKSAIVNNTYRFGMYDEMNTPATSLSLAHDLWRYVQERPDFETDFATFVASFAAPTPIDEIGWEELLWAQLQRLHDLDHPFHGWDVSVSSDPQAPDFSFSFAGTAFFIIGMHPASSRWARRFAWPTLVFNAHVQFENLRQHHQFERVRDTVRARDHRLQGSINPNLSTFGEASEARQYSAREVGPEWRCPFHVQPDNRPGVID